MPFLSIKSIDKLSKVCYTRIKLENKTNILTNNKHKQRKTKMRLTPYENESSFSSATNISPEAEKRIDAFQNRHRGAMSLLAALQQH